MLVVREVDADDPRSALPPVHHTVRVPEAAGSERTPPTVPTWRRRLVAASQVRGSGAGRIGLEGFEPDDVALGHRRLPGRPGLGPGPRSLTFPERRSSSRIEGPSCQAMRPSHNARPPKPSLRRSATCQPVEVRVTCGRQFALACSRRKPPAPTATPASSTSAAKSSAHDCERRRSGAALGASGRAGVRSGSGCEPAGVSGPGTGAAGRRRRRRPSAGPGRRSRRRRHRS